MAKQLSLKQQIYQQIANKQVQEVLNKQREQETANLMADFNSWQQQRQDPAQLMADFDAWKQQNAAPQPQVQPQEVRQTIPSIADVQPVVHEQTEMEKHIAEVAKAAKEKRLRERAQKLQQLEQIEASQPYTKKERETLAKVEDISKKLTNIIPETEALNTVTKTWKRGQRPEATDTSSQVAARVTNEKKPEIDTTNVPVDVDRWLSPDTKLTDAEKKKAKEYASAELQKVKYGPNKQPLLNTPEERQHYADMVNLINKTNGFTNFMSGAIEVPYNLADMVSDGARSVGNQLGGLGAAITDKLGVTEGATQRHNEEVEKANQFADQNEANMRQSFKNAQTQNPGAYTTGKIAGQTGMYILTNPVFDGIAAGAGVESELAKFFINQGAQNVQDLVLDTAPTVRQLMEDGSTPEEVKREALNNILWNVAGNAVMGGLGAWAGNRAARKASDEAFRENVRAGADNLSRIASEIPGIEDVDNVVRNATRQAETAAQNIENLNKQIPNLPDYVTGAPTGAYDVNTTLKSFNDMDKDLNNLGKIHNELGKEIDSINDPTLKEEFKNLNDTYSRMLDKSLQDGGVPASEWDEITEAYSKANKELRESAENYIRQNSFGPDIDNALNDIQSFIDSFSGEKELHKELTDSLDEVKNAIRNGGDIEGARAKLDNALNSAAEIVQQDNDSLLGDITSEAFQKVKSATDGSVIRLNKSVLKDALGDDAIFSDLNNMVYTGKGSIKFREGSGVPIDSIYNELRGLSDYELPEAHTEADQVAAIAQYISDVKAKNITPDNSAINEVKRLGNSLDEGIGNYNPNRDVPGADPLQTFADGKNTDEWKISKARTNSFENQGWGDQLRKRDYAYRVQHTAEQHEIKAERYKDSDNIARDLMRKAETESFDAADVKASMEEIQRLMDNDEVGTAKMLSQELAHQGREGGRTVQAFREYNKNTVSGALQDASNAQEDFVLEPWRSRNKKAREGNSRIAKALADMGHKPITKADKAPLTHDQIKNGVIAELNREVGSVEKYFNDNDIEFLTQLAEDKSIPTWKITSEIEHKLNTGNWYTLDESVEIPKPTNKKLQNALNSLVTEQVRAEKPAPTLQQITEEVRNTLGKESADFEGQFDDNDIEYIANLINNGATKEALANALDMKLATGSFGISDKTLQEVNNIFKSISKYDVDSKQFVEGQAEAYRLLAEEILPDATPMEKFEAWRYLAMLGNPKTMLRNFIGNKTFSAVTGMSNNIAALAEAGIDKGIKALGGEGIQRTKSVLNPISDKALIKAAKEDADISRYRQIIGSKYEKMDENAFRKQKSVFNSKLAQFYEKVTDAGISDYRAVKNKFSTSLAGYLKANGYDTNIFKAEDELARLKNLGESRLLSSAEKAKIESLTKDVEALEKARDFALKQAEYATFHEDNKMANMLSEWSRSSKERGTGIGHVLIEGMIPFKKTPANVLRSGVEYSPLGAIKSLKETGKLIYENTGKRAGNLADTYINKKGKEVARTFASDVIDSWAKTLTGTGLTALGFYLYNKGALHSSDPDTKYQDELEGHQNYAIEINGKSYTIDWAAPTVMPLMVGAEIAKVWNSTGKEDSDFYDHINEYLETANRLADPLVETSMLSGVKDTLDTAANFVRNNEAINIIPLLGYNLATGYATQAVPTIGGQIARTIDPTRRSTYTDKEGFVGVVDKQIKKQMNKIPGLSYRNQEFIDTYGRTQNNSPFNNPIGNLAYQMFSPGYLNNINETGADRISREAYAVGKNENTLPKWQSKFKDAEGKRVSPEDFKTASQAYGKANYEIRDALSNDDWFNSLDASQKEEVVKSVNTIAEHTGNAAIDPEYDKNSKPYQAYKQGGIPGLLDYYKDQQAGAKAKESGLGATSKAYKEIKEDVKNGNTEAAETKITDAQKITNAGINSYGYGAFKANKSRITNTDDWIKQYNAIDSLGTGKAKSDGFVNQDEFLAWVKKNGYSETQAANYAKLYGTWKKVPYIKKDGTWGFH